MSAQVRFKKAGSFAFYLSIPVLLAGSTTLLLTIVDLLSSAGAPNFSAQGFGLAFLLTAAVLLFFDLRRTKVLLHELKHAAVIILTGNRLTGMRVGRDGGHVRYALYMDSLHFLPFILLAPYVFPLLSLPALAAGLLLEDSQRELCVTLLGVALAADLTTNLIELHPAQTDLKRVFGGFLPVALYLAAANAFWLLCCLLWLLAGRAGFIRAGEFAWILAHKLF